MVAPNSSNHSVEPPKPRQSISRGGPKRFPVLRWVGLAAMAWLGVFLYTHAVFFKHAIHDLMVQKKEVHPAQQFLDEAKNLKQNVAQVRRIGLQTRATSACERTVQKQNAHSCVDDIVKLFHIDEKVAYHFIDLLKNSKEVNLSGSEAEHPCMRINMASHRSSCYMDILAIRDLKVAKKMAELLKLRAEDDGVTVHDAKIACALARNKDLCLHDVLMSGDLEVAEIYDKLPTPPKDKFGKYILQYQHHKLTEDEAIQSCRMVHPKDMKKCQENVMKMDDEETAEHYIHLLQDQEHHQEDSKALAQDVAKSLCKSVKQSQYREQCLEDIASLPNKHMAGHLLELYDEKHSGTLVSQFAAEKLCYHLKLSHQKHNYESCVKSLIQMKGIQAASHYSKLHSLQEEVEQVEEDPAEREIITKAKAISLCQRVKPKEQQEECQRDVQTIIDWDTAEKYIQLLVPEEAKREANAKPGQNGNSNLSSFKDSVTSACDKSAQVSGCVQGLMRLYHQDERIAFHFVRLLKNSKEKNLKAEHPCETVTVFSYRAACYQDTLATTDLTVAQKMADLLEEQGANDKVTEHDAKVVCALAERKGMCIHDILAIGDLDIADSYEKLPTPRKDASGKFLLEDTHHKFSESDAIQACKKQRPEYQKTCQGHVLKLGEKETAEHYIHLLQDQEYHQEDAKDMSEDEAKSFCMSVKNSQYQQQCLHGIGSLPNKHMADHFIHLFDSQQADSLVSQMDAEKLCHHIKLRHPERKLFESCVDSLTKMKGSKAATHYSKLLKMHLKKVQLEEGSDQNVLLTKAKAISICVKVKPKERQEECKRDVQTMTDWGTAERYAQLLSPDSSNGSNDISVIDGVGGVGIGKEAEDACKKSIHPDDVSECVDEILNLNTMNSLVARHYIKLLNSSGERNLAGGEAEHPCLQLSADAHRDMCYQHVLATSNLGVAKKIAHFIKADEDHKPAVTLHDATIACALAMDKAMCIHDVLGTGDLESAAMYDNHASPPKDKKGNIMLHSLHHHMTEKEAEQACKMVHPEDKDKCQKHVLTMDDEETAKHYIHLLQDVEHHLDDTRGVSELEATSLCTAVKNTKYHEHCLHDLHMLPNQHMAEHILPLYDDNHALAKVSLQDAQQLCNHLRLSKRQNNHDSCVKHLTGIKGIEAAAQYSKLLQNNQMLEPKSHQTKTLLTRAQANSVCGNLKPFEVREECRRDVQTMDDVVIAQNYAQHFTAPSGLEGEQRDESGTDHLNGKGLSKVAAAKQVELACKRSIHPDDVSDCIIELKKLNAMDTEVAQHYMHLLMATKEENLDGSVAEHPCLAIDSGEQKEACFQDVLATNDLVVAMQIAQLMKEKAESRGVTLHDASIACALAIQKALCIHDVMGTRDLETAEDFEKYAAPNKNEQGQLNLQPHHYKFSQKDAEQACRLMQTKEEKEKCTKHVLTMQNADTAEHYIHLLQDEEHHSDSQSFIGMKSAKALCAPIEYTQHYEQCLEDISILSNEHIASHFIPLYDAKHASEVVSQQDAEKLCNHMRLGQKQSDHVSCIKFLTRTKRTVAAAYCSKLLHLSQGLEQKDDKQKVKMLLTKEQADAMCSKVKPEEIQQECQKGVQTINDFDVAKRYALLLYPEAAEAGKEMDSMKEAAATDLNQGNGMPDRRQAVQEQATTACRKTMHPDHVPECIEEVLKLDVMNPQVAKHYLLLLMTSTENNLEGGQAQHPCIMIYSQTNRARCYQDISATSQLSMAKKIARLIKDSEKLEPAQVTLHDATIACALAREKAQCIHDVLGTGDLEAADMYDKMKAPKENKEGNLELEAQHHKMSQEEAEEACRIVHPDDQIKCQQHVLTMDDEETATHYIHLLQDSEHHSNMRTTISEAEAKLMCSSVQNTDNNKKCLEDVQLLPNKHMAEHFIPLYDDKHATVLVSQQHAEKLCNHLRLNNIENSHDSCLGKLTKTKGIEAAEYCSKLLRIALQKMESNEREENQGKPLLSSQQADSVCGKLKHKAQVECKKDVRNLNDIDVAQRYAELLAKA